MYSESDIEDAVQAGVLGPDIAAAFRDHVAAQRSTPAVDEEQFRLLTGFNDVFVSLALLLVLVPLLFLDRSGLVIAAVAWGLAEFFTRHRRMALPSILLLLAFVIGAYRAATGILGISVGLIGAGERGGPALAIVGLVCASAAALHWWRFKVPITIAAGIAALV